MIQAQAGYGTRPLVCVWEAAEDVALAADAVICPLMFSAVLIGGVMGD